MNSRRLPPFDRVEWLRLPLPPMPLSAAVFDTFEYMSPAVLRALFTALCRQHVVTFVPSDRFVERMMSRPPLLTWAERVSLVQNFPITAIVEVESSEELRRAIDQLQPAILYSVMALPGIRHVKVRASSLDVNEFIRRLRAVPGSHDPAQPEERVHGDPASLHR